MIAEFIIENFFSIKSPQKISFEPSSDTFMSDEYSYEVKDGVFDDYILINPKVISYSEEMIYAGEGEGCLSVNREVEGIVPRHARITVEAYELDGNKRKYRVREDLAIAFQHELDHLNGILFVDYIDPKDPYKNADLYREI